MGGQACVFYGAAEFSRDLDLLILADEANLDLLKVAPGGSRGRANRGTGTGDSIPRARSRRAFPMPAG